MELSDGYYVGVSKARRAAMICNDRHYLRFWKAAAMGGAEMVAGRSRV